MHVQRRPARGQLSLWPARLLARALPNPLLALPVVLLALALLAEAPSRITGDTWFDLVAGRDIVQHGLPHHDRLMAFTAGRSWQDQQWLAHLTAYGLYALGGIPLVAFADAGCLLFGLLIAMLAARSLGGSPMWIMAVALPAVLLVGFTPTRSESFAMPLFTLLVWLLARDARRPDRWIWLVLPLLVLWANLHGSVLLASALVLLSAVLAAGHALRRRALGDLWRPLALVLAAVVAPFASPYGLSLVSYYRSTAGSSAFSHYIAEWSGTTLRAWPAFFLFVAVVLIAVVRPEIRLPLFDALCLLALVLVGLDASRDVVWLPLAAVVLVPGGLARWSPEPALRSHLRLVLAVLALAGAVGVGLLAGRVSTPSLESGFPTAEGAAVAHAAAANPARLVLSDPGYADWLVWQYPALRGRVALDVRFELLGGSGLKNVAHLELAAGERWQRPFAAYRLALWSEDKNPELVAALLAEHGTWVLARGDGAYAFLLAR